jgi:hypothetical protein
MGVRIMGYYTQYEIEYVDGAEEDQVLSAIHTVSGYSSIDCDGIKWYDHEEDMRKVSLMFPDATICISGIGEEQPDMWKKWFRNGKMKTANATITYNEPKEFSE